MNDKIKKCIHRLDQQRIAIYCIFRSNIIIEELIDQKRKKKSDFKEKTFIKLPKKNKKNMIVEDNIKTNFVEKISIVMSKII